MPVVIYFGAAELHFEFASEVIIMLNVVYEFFALAGLETPPQNMAELVPYLLQFVVAVCLVLAVFKAISYIAGFFLNWRWNR